MGNIYNTGNPIALSSMRLREAIQAALYDVDPEGKDPALQRMVVMGHSQGGLLTKMTVVDSGTKFWDGISDVPFDQASLSPETRDLLRRSLFVQPLPPVKRVIFIATPHRGSFLAANFLGKIGRAGAGGLALAEFKRRQALHRDAEASAMKDVAEFIDKAHEIYGYDHFLNDAGGSICEIDDPEMLRVLDAHTLILYLRAGPDMEQALIRRAAENPKPLYYREDFLDQHVAQYLQLENLSSPDQVEHPDRFVRWIFPHLVRHRIPRYQAIAERYGYTVDARDLETVRDERDFLECKNSAAK